MAVGYNGNKIVTDGLVLCLDAANTKSYPGSGTTWTDLSGSNIFTTTLTNAPTFSSTKGGSFVFNGTSNYTQTTGSLVTSEATFILWLYRNGTQINYAGTFFSRGTSVTGIGFTGSTGSLGYHWNDVLATTGWVSGLVVPDLTWCMCAITVGPSSATAYLCQTSGITTAINTTSHTSTTIDDIRIGMDEFGSRYFKGNISQALLYNRALTATEIQQNFNILRGRYGV